MTAPKVRHDPVVDMAVDEVAAKVLQERLDVLNESEPPAMVIPYFSGNVRHSCPKARQSTATRAVSSSITVSEEFWTDDQITALVFRQGVCKKCGFLVRSVIGRAVNVADRPPLSGRVGRE